MTCNDDFYNKLSADIIALLQLICDMLNQYYNQKIMWVIYISCINGFTVIGIIFSVNSTLKIGGKCFSYIGSECFTLVINLRTRRKTLDPYLRLYITVKYRENR